MITRALIPAAGRGRRARPRTTFVPKVLLEVDGKTLIQRNVELLRDQLGITDITVVVGYRGDQIRELLGNGSSLDVTLRYLECDDVERGLASGVLLARDHFQEAFVTVLGDELYLDSNHRALRELSGRPFEAICGVIESAEPDEIRRNYSVRVEHGAITAVVEKPTTLENRYLGCGTYVFTPTIFEAIEQTPPSPRSGRVELTDAIGALARSPGAVLPFFIEGTYLNVNSSDELDHAQYLARAARFSTCRVSVVVPAFNEAESIGSVVRDLRDHVDEVFVVDNSSTDRTAEVAREAGARVETVRLTGYGDTIRHGLDHALGDVLVITEADFSFRARDLGKLLEYLKDADLVMGTRTTRALVEQDTNMRGLVRIGNIGVAKLVELLWWRRRARFTDVGCTYRALWRDTYQRIRPLLKGVGPELSPEMMVAALQADQRVIEVPVSYHRRVAGESKHSNSYLALSRTASRMLRTILRMRIGAQPRGRTRRAPDSESAMRRRSPSLR
jgi:UDP-N-acetylglucosamine diphosphorylase / glucose-1-phosphate thymidylyltransferase / UDP-N-acetylgalactosamine diphosphorylase / glucosamine-1-phosphate N-acetyltransferase / galactosamine-1-phosphate N-acetyltransferase